MTRSHCDGEAAEVVFWHLVPLEVFQPRSTAWRFQSGPQAHRRGLYISHFSLSPITFRIPQEELESLAREMDSCLAFTSAFTAFFFFMWCKKVDFEININCPTSHFLFCFLVFFIFQSFETKLFNCIWYLCVEVYMCDLLRYCLCLSSDWMTLASS